MARTETQSGRMEGEHRQAVETRLPVVDRLYRLQPADLGGMHARPHSVVVRFVGSQGVERPVPVMHFEGVAKPLMLDAVNVAAIVRIAGSSLPRDWLRTEVVLAVVVEDGLPCIRLLAPGDPMLGALRRKSAAVERTRAFRLYLRQALRAALAFGSLAAILLLAVFLIENWAALLAMVLSAFAALRNAS
jgi:hypothetical protein